MVKSEPSAATDGSLICDERLTNRLTCIWLWQPSGFPHLYYIHPCQKCQIHFDRNCPGETVCVFAEGFPMIQPGTARLPRPLRGLAMTNLLALRHRIRTAKPTACMALTERRYRRNRFVRYYRRSVRIGSVFPRLPRRPLASSQ